MAYPAISLDHITPVFNQGYEEGKFEDNSFAFYLTAESGADGSALVLGGVDPQYATTPFKYYPVRLQAWWVVDVRGITVNGQVIHLDGGIVDSGTSVLVGSPSAVKKVFAAGLPDSQQVDCDKIDTYPSISFNVGGDEYALAPTDYIIKATVLGVTQCILGIMELELPPQIGKEAFILGDSFMHKYYSHFDFGNNRVGFSVAKSNGKTETIREI